MQFSLATNFVLGLSGLFVAGRCWLCLLVAFLSGTCYRILAGGILLHVSRAGCSFCWLD